MHGLYSSAGLNVFIEIEMTRAETNSSLFNFKTWKLLLHHDYWSFVRCLGLLFTSSVSLSQEAVDGDETDSHNYMYVLRLGYPLCST